MQAPPLPAITPTHDLIIGQPGSSGVVGAVFGSDGRLYVDTHDFDLNLWHVFLEYWPTFVGAALAVLLVVVLRRAVRILGQARQGSKLYCPKCNYEVGGLPAGSPCSECGTDLARFPAVRGTMRWRRLVRPALHTMLIVATFLGVQKFRSPIRTAGRFMFQWSAPQLMDWAVKNNFSWITQCMDDAAILSEFDPVSGRSLRRVGVLGWSSNFAISISPDGKSALGKLERGELVAIDLDSGTRRRTLGRLDGVVDKRGENLGEGWAHTVGWLNADEVLVQWLDPVPPKHEVYRWHVRTGALRKVCDVPVPAFVGQRVKRPLRRLLHLIRAANPPIALEFPDRYGEGIRDFQARARARNMSDGGSVLWETTGIDNEFPPVATSDGSIFFARKPSWKIVVSSTLSGDRLAELDRPPGLVVDRSWVNSFMVHETTKRLFEVVHDPDSIFVTDLASGQSLGRLDIGFPVWATGQPTISADGRWIAIPARGQPAPTPQPSGIIDHLLIFDLNKLGAADQNEGDSSTVPLP